MHGHEIKENSSLRQFNHGDFLFYGWGSHLYNVVMVRLASRLYQRVIADIAPVLSEGKVLDAGTGPGTEERVHFAIGNVAHLPYPDHSFDLVVSTISMHHWYELEQPLRDLYRILRPGGRLWIYDFRLVKAHRVEKALASTPFVETPLEHTLVRTGFFPFALYRRFALQKMCSSDHQQGTL
jgi:SAM-dependent methyltransferase